MEIIELTREIGDLKERFIRSQEITDGLCDPLSPEDCALSVTEDTSPPKWHLGHTSWFYAQFLLENFTSYEVTPEFCFMFNSYYKGLGDHLAKTSRRSISRPGVIEVREWRMKIRERVIDCLDTLTTEQIPAARKMLEMGINHEQQHQELLLMDIKRNFYENPMRPRYKSRSLSTVHEHRTPEWINIPSGLINIGVPHSSRDDSSA